LGMRVAMLTYSTRPRGGVVHALKLAERLSNLGADVTLYSLSRSDDPVSLAGYFRKVSVPFKIFEYEWHSDLVTRLERMIDSYSYGLPREATVYHAQDCVGGTALARMKARGLISAPVFRTIHHIDDFSEPRLFEFEKRAVGLAEHRFVVSKFWQKELRNAYGFDSIVTYNGMDPSDFSNLPSRSSNVPTVLFVGGLEPRKGLEYLIRAMERVADVVPDVRLVAVAKTGFRGTDQWQTYKSLAEGLNILGRIDYNETVDESKLLQFYADCDVLVLPSKTEGWGLSLMEAMVCGKPVVASKAGGIPELVRDGVDGILVDTGDVRWLAEGIVSLLKDPALRDKMGMAGRERASQFSWDRTAQTVLETYEQTLRSS
jgi:glycosyltransferase involved in cell wall biosynthesis